MTPRIAIACSGLGNVRRGNESWARDVGQALHEAGTSLTLFGGGSKVDVSCPYEQITNVPRDSFLSRLGVSWHHRYLLEQRSFAWFLQRRLPRGCFDVVEAADPTLAWLLHRNRTAKQKVIYQDGLLLGAEWCSKFEYAQVLAPFYQEQAAAAGVNTSNWFVIPQMVDTKRFAPKRDRAELRARVLGGSVPADALVVMAAGDYSPGSNKRLDWVLQEFTQLRDPNAHLIVTGQSSPADFARFSETARQAIGARAHLFTNLNATQMVELYQSADVFAHAALREPFGIVFIEAMACGLPVVAHTFEVSKWIVGGAGENIDMTAPGEMAKVLTHWQADRAAHAAASARARQRAEDVFSPQKLVPLYNAMYARLTQP
jgi:glycosyltransferase involved in cell wall biosynthesis